MSPSIPGHFQKTEVAAMKKALLLFITLILVVTLVTEVYSMKESKAEPKKAILLVAFGTSIPEAQKAYENIDAMAKKAFPETTIRWAYTSKKIRAKLAKQGKQLDSPELALAKEKEGGLSTVTLDEMDFGHAEDREDQTRQAGAAPEVDEAARTRREEAEELGGVEDVTAPRIVERRGAHEIDAGLPTAEFGEPELEALECFT
jgi:sirohydrochlorin cobaltochelatase